MEKQKIETLSDLINWMTVLSQGYDILLAQKKMNQKDESLNTAMSKLSRWVSSEVNDVIEDLQKESAIAVNNSRVIPTRVECRKQLDDNDETRSVSVGIYDGFILASNYDDIDTSEYSQVDILISNNYNQMPDLDDMLLFCYKGFIYCGYIQYYIDDIARKFVNIESLQSERVTVYHIKLRKLDFDHIATSIHKWWKRRMSYAITVAHNIVHEQRDDLLWGYIDTESLLNHENSVTIYVPRYTVDRPGFRVSGERDYITLCDYNGPAYIAYKVDSVEERTMEVSNAFTFGEDHADMYVFHCTKYSGNDVIFR